MDGNAPSSATSENGDELPPDWHFPERFLRILRIVILTNFLIDFSQFSCDSLTWSYKNPILTGTEVEGGEEWRGKVLEHSRPHSKSLLRSSRIV